MSKGNPNWGKMNYPAAVPTITEFERQVENLKLTPDQFVTSPELQDWVRKNRNTRYVPEPLLEAWGMEIDTNF